MGDAHSIKLTQVPLFIFFTIAVLFSPHTAKASLRPEFEKYSPRNFWRSHSEPVSGPEYENKNGNSPNGILFESAPSTLCSPKSKNGPNSRRGRSRSGHNPPLISSNTPEISNFQKAVSKQYSQALLFRGEKDEFDSFNSSLSSFIDILRNPDSGETLSENDKRIICLGIERIVKEINHFCEKYSEKYSLIPREFKRGQVKTTKLEVLENGNSIPTIKTFSDLGMAQTYQLVRSLREFTHNYKKLLLVLYDVSIYPDAPEIQLRLQTANQNMREILVKYQTLVRNRRVNKWRRSRLFVGT